MVNIARPVFKFGGMFWALLLGLSREPPHKEPLEYDGHDETNGNNTDVGVDEDERDRERPRKERSQSIMTRSCKQ